MKMVYIASPLRGDYNTNIKNAVEYCRLAAEKGVLPLAPHIIFSQWCNDTIPIQTKQGMGTEILIKAEIKINNRNIKIRISTKIPINTKTNKTTLPKKSLLKRNLILMDWLPLKGF